MAAVPICYKMPYKDQAHLSQKVRQHERGLSCPCSAFVQVGTYLSISCDVQKSGPVLHATTDISKKKFKTGRVTNASKGTIFSHGPFKFQSMIDESHMHRFQNTSGENLSMVCYASKSSAEEKQLRLLDSYFRKLQESASELSSDPSDKRIEAVDESVRMNVKEELEYLNAYPDKLDEDANAKNNVSSIFEDKTTKENSVAKAISVSKESRRGDEVKIKSIRKVRNKDAESGSRRPEFLEQDDKTSDLYLIGALASINIAVFLFDIASPVRNSEFELYSIPLLYGAKINDLILVGEWWRLVTPMFLHAGAFHVALGCWSLLTFGPEVCRGYGSFTFFLIYILGGISGNLTSFLHTPEPTVGGTGPIFALIGAWLIYQNQNKDVISKDAFDHMFQKASTITAISFILSHFGPTDDWTHLGAVLTGIAYGFFTCSTLQLDNASSRSGQDEGISIVKRHVNPCKSLIIFTIVIIFLSSLLFLVEPPLDTIVTDNFVRL